MRGDDPNNMPAIIVDTREQRPFSFEMIQPVPTIKTATLKIGDYSIEGAESLFAVERKSLADLIGCICTPAEYRRPPDSHALFGRDRFEAELERSRALRFFGVICEGGLDDVENQRYRSMIAPNLVWAAVRAWEVRYRVPFCFAGTRLMAARMTYAWLRHCWREYVLKSESEGKCE